jgi:hypothetical protein
VAAAVKALTWRDGPQSPDAGLLGWVGGWGRNGEFGSVEVRALVSWITVDEPTGFLQRRLKCPLDVFADCTSPRCGRHRSVRPAKLFQTPNLLSCAESTQFRILVLA